MKFPLPSIILSLALSSPTLAAQVVPSIVPHQGRIVVNGTNFEGVGQFKFHLYQDADDDHENDNESPIWKNDGSDPKNPVPDNAVTVNVTKGRYSVDLGDISIANMTALPGSLAPPPGSHTYLRVWFDDGVHGFEQLAPDQRLLAVPFALHAGSAGRVTSGGVSNDALENGSITADKLFPGLQSQETNVSDLPEAGGVVHINFDKPYDSTPEVKVLSPGLEAFGVGPNGFSVRVPPGRITVASAGNVGMHSKMRVIAGRACIAYYDATATALMFVRALDESGSAWGNPIIVDTTNDTGRNISLANVGGHPAIAYRDVTNGNLRYARASNPEGSVWGTLAVVDGLGVDGVFGEFTSLAVIAGRPAIAYQADATGTKQLRYAYAEDALGSSWMTPFQIGFGDGIGQRGFYPQLAVFDGKPGIVDFNPFYRIPEYLASTTVTGAEGNGGAWTLGKPINRSGYGGAYISMALQNDVAILAHVDEALGLLFFSRAANAAADEWLAPVVIAGGAPAHASLAIIDGFPAVAWQETSTGDLMYSRALNAEGTAWEAPQVLDSSFDVGSFASLQEVNGKAAVAYYDATLGNLKFTTVGRPFNNKLSWQASATPAPIVAAEVAKGSIRPEHFATGTLGRDLVITGNNSFALGEASHAAGDAALAAGQSTHAAGAASVALGANTSASGANSLAIGLRTVASGDHSVAMGYNTHAKSFGEVVIGQFNVIRSDASATEWVPSQSAFVVGGGSNGSGLDLFRVRKDGQVFAEGDYQTKSDYTFRSRRTFHKRISARMFQPASDSNSYKKDSGLALTGTDTSQKFFAPLEIPLGAEIGRVTVDYVDDADDASFVDTKMWLYWETGGETADQLIGPPWIIDTAIFNGNSSVPSQQVDVVIDTTEKALYLRLDFNVSATSPSVRFLGVNVEYSHDRLTY